MQNVKTIKQTVNNIQMNDFWDVAFPSSYMANVSDENEVHHRGRWRPQGYPKRWLYKGEEEQFNLLKNNNINKHYTIGRENLKSYLIFSFVSDKTYHFQYVHILILIKIFLISIH